MPQDPYAEFQIPASSPYAEFQAPKQQLGPPPGVPRPPNPIEQDIQYRATAPTAGLPGGSINPQPATDTMGMVAGGAIGAAALASPAVLPYTMSAIKSIPYFAAAEGINQARKHLPLGKYIPQGAELAPFLLGGKGGAAESEAVGTKAAESEAAATAEGGGGHAGGGVASAEELSRPGQNYVVSKTGQLTYHGKAFAPEETPRGGAHVTVLPSGEMRVNAGELNPMMQASLEKATAGTNPYATSGAPQSMEPVQSTNVAKIGHNGKDMWVEYKTGQVYQYKGVSPEEFKAVKNADSVGSYISRNIKGAYGTNYKGTVPRGKAMAAD